MKLIKIILMSALFCLAFYESSNSQTVSSTETSNKQSQKDKPLKIKNKPIPQYPRGECRQRSGKNSFRITFDKSGEISGAAIVSSSGCSKFDEIALRAALQIKFSPAEKDGQPITVVKVVEYSFSSF